MKKSCIFCGEKPTIKTGEHVLPLWLIKLTGDPKRVVFLGPDYSKKEWPPLRFSFDQFQVPACEKCNSEFGALENSASDIVQKILSHDKIGAGEFSILLDWFDKLRVGMWLASRYLSKNIADVEPKFHIRDRVGVYDRLVVLFRVDVQQHQQLTSYGVGTPSFAYTPSCFSLIINNYCFLNMSYQFLFARRMGLPYPKEQYLSAERREVECTMTRGRERVMLPLLKKPFRLYGSELYQAMFPGLVHDARGASSCGTDYVRNHSMIWVKGIGKIYKQEGRKLEEYPAEASLDWIPENDYKMDLIDRELKVLTLEWQYYIDDELFPSLDNLPPERKKYIRRQVNECKKINQYLISKLRESHP